MGTLACQVNEDHLFVGRPGTYCYWTHHVIGSLFVRQEHGIRFDVPK